MSRSIAWHACVPIAVIAMAALGGCRRTPQETVALAPVAVTGAPADWRAMRVVIAERRRLRCLEPYPGRAVVRVIWEGPPAAQDVDLASGGRTTSRLHPEAFRAGCARISRGGLLSYSTVKQGRLAIQHSSNEASVGPFLAEGWPLAWLDHSGGLLYSYDGRNVAVAWPSMAAALLPSAPAWVRGVLGAAPHGSDSPEVSILYETGDGTLVIDYDHTSRRALRTFPLGKTRLLLWHDRRQRLQLLVDDEHPAWAELQEPRRLRRLGTLGSERTTHAIIVAGGLAVASVDDASGETRLRVVADSELGDH